MIDHEKSIVKVIFHWDFIKCTSFSLNFTSFRNTFITNIYQLQQFLTFLVRPAMHYIFTSMLCLFQYWFFLILLNSVHQTEMRVQVERRSVLADEGPRLQNNEHQHPPSTSSRTWKDSTALEITVTSAPHNSASKKIIMLHLRYLKSLKQWKLEWHLYLSTSEFSGPFKCLLSLLVFL